MMNDQSKSLKEQLSESKSESITKKQFDTVVYATGYVRLVDGNMYLEGLFTPEALRMIDYAMRNEPEWFKLDDQA